MLNARYNQPQHPRSSYCEGAIVVNSSYCNDYLSNSLPAGSSHWSWMAPPGISTFFHNLDTITFYSHCGTPSAPLKPAAPSSSSPTPKSFQSSMPYHSPVHSDHDYIIKPFNHSSGFGMVSNGVEGTGSALDHDYSNGAGDAMLSSCAVDLEKAPEDEADTDFLKELGTFE